MNDISQNLPLIEQMTLAKGMTVDYVQRLYAQGPTQSLIDEGMKLGDVIFQIVKRHDCFNLFLQQWSDYEPNFHAHPFQVAMFSMMICKSMEWDSPRSIQAIVLGALVHDIGMTKLPEEIWETPQNKLNQAQYQIYTKHTQWGMELLQGISNVPEAVIQIVYQHHETSDGLGFPNELSSTKIYPLAKVVTLADQFARTIVEKNVPPYACLPAFITDPINIKKFDSDHLKAFIKCFLKANKKKG